MGAIGKEGVGSWSSAAGERREQWRLENMPEQRALWLVWRGLEVQGLGFRAVFGSSTS